MVTIILINIIIIIGIYGPDTPDADKILSDAELVYKYVNLVLNFDE